MVFQINSGTRKLKYDITMTVKFRTDSRIPFHFILESQILLLIPCQYIILPDQKKIAFYTSDPLPDYIYLASKTVKNFTTPCDYPQINFPTYGTPSMERIIVVDKYESDNPKIVYYTSAV